MHQSDSTEQQTAEGFILESISIEVGFELKPRKLKLPSGCRVQLDGFNEDYKILCEVYAHVGKMKGSQPDKVASDFLKMLLVEKMLEGKWEKHYCFASHDAASRLKGNSWIANTAKQFSIFIHVYPLPEHIASSVVKAQKRQKMVNIND